MRSPRLLFLVALAACGDDATATHDAATTSDANVDAPACAAPPLAACANPVSGTNITLRRIGTSGLFGSQAALLVTSPPNDERLFVVTREGEIRILENEVVNPTPFLDLGNVIQAGGEQGLLGLAFHPLYNCNGTFYVYYTTNNQNVVARCSVSANPNVANSTCTPIISIYDFAGNHNGGMIEFGSDGYLYIGTGDGGSGGDPRRNGQALNPVSQGNGEMTALQGKILRIDVDNPGVGMEYAIPPTNPFASGGGAAEIWMYGLRNPWRWSFDKATGDIWIGDVGQIKTEELTAVRGGQQAGKNLGWSIWEGNGCCMDQGEGDPGDDDLQSNNNNGCNQALPQQTCDMSLPNLVFPQDTRLHPQWISVIAGTTYRGTCYPDIVGWHFYTDHSSGGAGLHRAQLNQDNTATIVDYPSNAPQLPNGVTSMHHDARGEIWITTLGGSLYHLEAGP